MRKITVIALLLGSVAAARAGSTELEAILQERDATLVKILEWQKARHQHGGAEDPNAVFTAQLALYVFRRDSAATVAKKIENQSRIVALHDQREIELKARVASGVADAMEVLRAKDAQLQARQLLEELKARVPAN